MRDYTIYYKSGETKEVEVAGRKELIDSFFHGSESELKEQVDLLKWKSANMFYTEDVAKGEINSQITTADSNPYGWRNEGNLDH